MNHYDATKKLIVTAHETLDRIDAAIKQPWFKEEETSTDERAKELKRQLGEARAECDYSVLARDYAILVADLRAERDEDISRRAIMGVMFQAAIEKSANLARQRDEAEVVVERFEDTVGILQAELSHITRELQRADDAGRRSFNQAVENGNANNLLRANLKSLLARYEYMVHQSDPIKRKQSALFSELASELSRVLAGETPPAPGHCW